MKQKLTATTNKVDHYYGNQQKYMLCKDKLVLNLTSKIEGTIFNLSVFEKDFTHDEFGIYSIGNSYTLHQSRVPDNGYNYSFNINRNDEFIGSIHLNGRGHKHNLTKLEFSNRIFYYDGFNWHIHFQNLCKLLGLKLNNISVLHIAFDSSGLYDWYEERYFKSTVNTTLIDPDYEPFNGMKPYHLGSEFIFGKIKSGKANALYKKHIEIKHSGKTYISDAHIHNGLSLASGIDRLEARLGNKWLTRHSITLDDIITQEGLERVFAKAIKNVGFKDLKAPKVRDDNDHYELQRLPIINPSTFKITPFVKIKKDKVKSWIKSERAVTNTFKSLFDSYIASGRKEELRYLRFFMSCKENYLLATRGNFYNGTKTKEELSEDNYRALVKRYIRSYPKDKAELNKAMVYRLKNIEIKLFTVEQ